MRSDMAHLLVERGRRGTSWHDAGLRRARRERRDVRCEGMMGRDGSGWFDEYLSPLRRLLRSRVGRPWDAVYSEIRTHVRLSRTVDYHIWQHLQWEVQRHVPVVAGAPRPDLRPGWFWVCPLTGLLRANPERRRRRPEPVPTGRDAGLVKESDHSVLARLDGVWFRLTLTSSGGWPKTVDLGGVAPLTREHIDRLVGRTVAVVAKRQLGKRELRDLGLRRA